MEMAIKHFSAVSQDPTAEPGLKAMNGALLACAEGDWDKANNILRQIIHSEPDNYVVCNISTRNTYLFNKLPIGRQQSRCHPSQSRSLERGQKFADPRLSPTE